MLYMYVMIFFDLPTDTKKSRRQYTQFRKFLINEGFFMMQFSIYFKVCLKEKAKAVISRIENSLPKFGNVRALEVTERQYKTMKVLLGNKKKSEEIYSKQLSFF